ncbi:MAG TPA: hypothetical protein VMF13_09040 [Luteitalea sp.]|nr:hypothetical protein [Luteitalea sp.]
MSYSHPSNDHNPVAAGARLSRAGRDEVAVGDVYVCRDVTGFGIFNYRGEPVLDEPVGSPDEAARLAREIVSPWQGHVVVDDPSDG